MLLNLIHNTHMKNNLLSAVIALGMALTCSSCMFKSSTPVAFHGDHADTANSSIGVDTADVQIICPRVTGKSQGFKILGLIPVRLASETEAVNNMYQDARNRSCPPEGRATHFINHSYEYSSNYRFLYSRPEIRASADLAEILPPGKGLELLRARAGVAQAPAKPAPAPQKKGR